MLVAVIDLAVGVAGDGHGDLVGQRGDGQRTFLIGDVVVLGDVLIAAHQLRIARNVVARADVQLAASQGHARDGVALGGIGTGGVAVLRQRRAVIGLVGRARGDGQIHRGDLQRAVGHVELHVRKVVADVLELRLAQVHLIGALVGAGRGVIAIEGEIIRRIERIVRGNRVAGHGLRRTVIGHAIGLADDGHDDLVGHGGDSQLAELSRDLVVRSLRVLVQRVGEGVFAGADLRLAAGDIVRRALALGEAVAADGHGAVRQGLAVIDLLAAVGGQGDGAGIDLQLTVLHRNIVSIVNIRRTVHDGDVFDLVGGGQCLHVGDGAHHRCRQDVTIGQGQGLACLQLIGLAVEFNGIAAVRQGLAVISLALAVGDDGHALCSGPAHGQLAVFDCDIVVRGLTRGKLIALHHVIHLLVRILDRADDRHCDGVVPDKAGNLRLRQGVRLAVVGEVRALRGDGHGARGDGQLAVGHGKLNVREVRVVILELLRFQAHLVGVRVGTLRDGLTGKGEVAHGIELVVDRGGIAGHGMLVAVIDLAVGVAGDGHGDLVGHGRDLQLALTLRDGVVSVLEAVGGGVDDGVRLFAVGDVRDGAGGVNAAHLARDEPVARDGDIGPGQGRAVIGLVATLRGQIDGARRNRQLAVLLHDKRDALEVFVRILELAGIEMHQIAARVGALRRGIAGEGEVLLRIERIFRGKRVAGRGVLVAVIGHVFGVAGDGHNDAADRGDRQLAVMRRSHDILFRGVDGADRTVRELRVIRSDVRALRTDGDGAEVRAVRRAGEAGDAVLLAVIDSGTAVRGQGDVLVVVEVDNVRARPDRQITGLILQSGISVNRNRHFICNTRAEGLAAHGLGLGHLIGCAVPVVVDGIAQVAADRPRAGQGDVLSGHLELTVADARIVRRPAAEHIAVQLGLCGHGHVRVHLVGFIRGQLSKCAGGNIALVLILHLIARDRPLDAGDGELEGLVAAGEGSLRIRGIILALFEVLAGGVELHRVGEPIGVGGLAAVGRFYAVCQLPRIGLAIRRDKVVGFCRDADVRPHGVFTVPLLMPVVMEVVMALNALKSSALFAAL